MIVYVLYEGKFQNPPPDEPDRNHEHRKSYGKGHIAVGQAASEQSFIRTGNQLLQPVAEPESDLLDGTKQDTLGSTRLAVG